MWDILCHHAAGGQPLHLIYPSSDPAKATQPSTLRLQFIGSNADTRLVGKEQLPGMVNYFLGNDPDKWRTNIPTYGSIGYEGLYPGIYLAYNGGESALKGTFFVAPGAKPNVIRWRYEGASKVELSDGELLIGVDENGKNPLLIERKPIAWQTVAGKHVSVNAHYVVYNDGSIGFNLGAYDTAQPLAIDPTLDYGTFWGLSGCDGAARMALDSNNNIYITGTTNSPNYPPTNTSCTQNQYFDVFVTKLDPSKTGANQHIYTTYFGGSHFDMATGIGADNAGNAYLAGYTRSTNLPTTTNAYQRNTGGSYEGIVIQLNAAGDTLQYVSYLGGTSWEELWGLAVGNGPLVYVTGLTSSSNFPTTANAYSSTQRFRDAFVSVFDTSKSGSASLVYSTLYGGSADDAGYEIAVSGSVIYFAGNAISNNLPLKNPVQTTYGGDSDFFLGDIFAAVLDPSQSGQNQLLFATYLGGTGFDFATGIRLGTDGKVYVGGATRSTDFSTARAYQSTNAGHYDAFVVSIGGLSSYNLYFPLVVK